MSKNYYLASLYDFIKNYYFFEDDPNKKINAYLMIIVLKRGIQMFIWIYFLKIFAINVMKNVF